MSALELDFKHMFKGADAFNQDLSDWDVSSGKDFYGMFMYAQTFNSNSSDWDVSSGTDFGGTSRACG